MRLLPSRKYKSGTRWGFWLWTDVDNEFIRRLHLVKTPWFSICLHWILKPDPEPYLHDHPVSFLSVVLRGWYTEIRSNEKLMQKVGPRSDHPCSPCEARHHRWFNYIRATDQDRHTITECHPKTITLCFMGPKTREWGYHTKGGWTHWKDYTHGKYRQEP